MEMEVIKYLSIFVLGSCLGILAYRQRLKTLENLPDMDLYLNDFRVLDLYEAINHSLHTNQSKLTFIVTEMNTNTFAEVYHSLRNNNLKFELKCSKNTLGENVEYLEFDFSNYNGPRNKNITPIWSRAETAQSLQNFRNHFEQELPSPLPPRRPTGFPQAQGNVISLFSGFSKKKVYTNNVITVDFKNKKVVSG